MVQIISTWTDDRIAQLTDLWVKGFSCAQIAAELGHATRNAVIGKVHRLGLSREKEIRVKVDAPRAPREHKALARVVKSNGNSNSHRVLWSVEAEPIEMRCAAVEPLHLAEPETGKCKYPYGDGPFSFCGHDAPGKTYCDLHHELCYRPMHGLQGRASPPQAVAAMRRRDLPSILALTVTTDADPSDWVAA